MRFNGETRSYLKVTSDLFRPPTPPILFNERGTKKRFEGYIFPVPVSIQSDDNVEFIKQDLAEWLYHEEPKELIFEQVPDRIYFAEYDGADFVERGRFARGYINFWLRDAHRYSPEKSLQSNGTHIIQGHESTFWRTRTEFTSNVTGYELAFTPAGKSELKDINKIVLNGDFRSGDILEIDYRKRKVTLNGNDISNQLVIMQSNYKELDIGNVEVSSSVPTTVYYHERYY